ncbi:hypothetical protein W04_2543 [Pseudoalteromonas sp. SW0106-04]|nr:hypothetical protein W04_2543 [Pseudoalteromonas sp. SW0106-04]
MAKLESEIFLSFQQISFIDDDHQCATFTNTLLKTTKS